MELIKIKRSAKVSIHHTRSVSLNSKSHVFRVPPRPMKEQEPDYEEKYDYTTVLYDIFPHFGKYMAVAPPTQNLKAYITHHHQRISKDRTEIFHFNSLPQNLEDLIDLPVDISHSNIENEQQYDCFENLNVVVTMSKNNDLQWIKDWAEFYGKKHNIKGVLIYDNNSTDYEVEDIANTLSTVSSIDVAVVVKWPFKYGPETKRQTAPKGKPLRKRPDSNYCQLSMFEHARWKYLSKSALVVNCDIDELVISESSQTISDIIKDGVGVSIDGTWIHTTKDAQFDNKPPRHKDYWLFDEKSTKCATKWAVRPSMVSSECQWMTHRINGLDLPTDTDLRFRHFRGINTNWKENRTSKFDNNVSLKPDLTLKRDLNSAFNAEESK